MIRAVMIAAVALMLSAGPAVAAKVLTGNGLLEQCREYEKLQAGQDYNYADAGLCLGYMTGVWDMVRGATSYACTPDGANPGQVTLVVIKHLKENPASLRRTAVRHVVGALQEAWPCPK